MARIQDIAPELLQFTEASAPDTPASGVVRIYAKTDGKLYCKDDADNEYILVGAAAADVSIADSGELFTATDVEGALAELFTSGSNGKAALETAIEIKGGTVDKAGDIATFAELEDGVDSIPTGSGTYQSKTVTPDAAGQTVTPDAGYDALSQVTINGDADLIPDNIKKDVTIYGVTGTLSGGNQSLSLSFFTVVSPNIATFTLT